MLAQPMVEATRDELAPVRRPWWSRVSAGQVLMVLAAVVAFIVNVALVRSADETVLVAVAAYDLGPGDELTESAVDLVEFDAASALVDRLITETELSGMMGRIATTRVAAGDLIGTSALRTAAAPMDLRAISIPVKPEHAAGGRLLGQGDQVDVIAVRDGVAEYVVAGVEVLDLAGDDDRGLTAGSSFWLVVAVDADSALAISQALAADSIEVVRSTGAPPPERSMLEPAPEPATEPVPQVG